MYRIALILSLSLVVLNRPAVSQLKPASETFVVFLGTGTPNADPEHSGPSLAIIANGKAYLVDFGPGLVRQASRHSPEYGGKIDALSAANLTIAFLTHLHSDHTTGYPDLILTPWVLGRNKPLEIYGPEGITEMTDNILKAYDEDIKYRIYGREPANNAGWRVNTHVIDTGIIYRDENVIVEAFRVKHGTWPNAFGFRFTTSDKVIVVSGDATPSEALVRYAKNADILIHEVYSYSRWLLKDEFWKAYHAENHTSTYELAKLANEAKPKLLILYHLLAWGATEDDILNEIGKEYSGKTVIAGDNKIYK